MEHPVLTPPNADMHTEPVHTSQSDRVKTLAQRLTRSRQPAGTQGSRRTLLLFILVALLSVPGYWIWQAYRPQPVEVVIASYQRAGAAAHPILRQSGFVTYPRMITVGSNSAGIIDRITFEEGDAVQKGEILASFDDKTLLAQKSTHEAAVQDARQTLTRTQNLHAAGAASSIALQQAQTRLQAALAQVELVDVLIESAQIRAPFSGRILERLADVGERVPAGICILVDDSKTLIEIEISQDEISLLQENQPALVVLDAYPEMEYAGELFRMRPMASRTTNTIRAQVELFEPDPRILPNMSARVYFVSDEQTSNAQVYSVLALDQSALFTEGSESYVWIVEGGRTHARRVEIGSTLGGEEIEIIEGLQADDVVIKSPSQYALIEDIRVEIIQ